MNRMFQGIMDQIDDVKGKLSDSQYLNLCNIIMEAKNKSEISTLYNITYIEVDIRMDQTTISTLQPKVVTQIIDPYKFFVGISKECMPERLKQIQDSIQRDKFASALQRCSCDNTVINAFFDDEESGEPITLRLDKSNEVIIISLTPYGI